MSKLHGWRRPVRWARNIFLGVVGLVTVVVLGAYLFFETSYGKGVLRGQIESRMASTFIGGAKIGGLEGNPFSELVLTNVVINDAAKQPAIRVKRLTIKLPLMPLISHQLRVDGIIADELDVRIARDSSGKLNLAGLTKPSEPSKWNIKLPNLEVHRSHLRIELTDEPIDLDNVEVVVDAALPFAGPIDADVSVSANWRQKQAPLDLAANVHVDNEELRVKSAAIQLADIDVALTQLAIPRGQLAPSMSGVVSVYAPAATLHKLRPELDLPGDVGLFATASAAGRVTHAKVQAALGTARAKFDGDVDIQARLVRGVVSGDDLDLTQLSRGRIDGHGGVVASFDFDGNDPAAEFPTINAKVSAWGRVGQAPSSRAELVLASKGEELKATGSVVADTGIKANLDAVVRKHGDHIVLERGDVIAATADARRASQGKVPLRGALDANLHITGHLGPRLDLAVAGHANGRKLRFADASAGAVHLQIDARHLPTNPVGSARVSLESVRRGNLAFRKLTVAAGNRPDGKLQVSLRSQPEQAPWLVDLDALVTTGDTITIDLQRHLVRAAGGSVWKGTRGTLTVTPREIVLAGFESRSEQGSITADATYVRAGRKTGDVTAKLDGRIELGSLGKHYKGKVSAHVDVTRTAGLIAGLVDAKATAITLNPAVPGTLDASVKLEAKAGQVIGNAAVQTQKAGSVAIALDVDAPKDITDARAWAKLGRGAIRTAQLTLKGVDLAEAAKLAGMQPMAGHVEGEIKLTTGKVGGLIRARGVELRQTKDLGAIQADLQVIDGGNGEVRATVSAHLQPLDTAIAAKDITRNGAAKFLADARFKTPDRLFDLAAWRQLGAHAFRGGMVRAERLAFQPGTLERFGIVSDMRGELAVGAEVDEAMSAARLAVNFYNLRGGVLAQPINASLSAVVDDRSSRLTASVSGMNVTLLRLSGKIPVTLAQLRADPQSVKLAPLSVTALIEHVPAKTLLNVLGTGQISGGTLDGKIEVGGSVDTPTVKANIVGRNVTVPSDAAHPAQGIKQLTIDADWDGATGTVAIDGDETGGGKLALRATGKPSELAAVTASLEATKLDIAPLVAFMPGPAGGMGGQLDASFKLKGADPRTADLAGNLHITNGRIPIAPAVGTLFKGDVKFGVKNRVLDLAVSGKLGNGDLKLTANAPLDGASPRSGKLKLTVRKVQLIGTTEPIISAQVDADVSRVDNVWLADMVVSHTTVKIPKGKGTKLSPVGAPPDLVYGGEKIHHGVNKGNDVPRGLSHPEGPGDFKTPSQVEGPVANRREPSAPIVAVKIKVRDVFVESDDARGLVGGNLKVTVGANAEVGIIGNLAMTRGVLDLFSRRYDVDKANLQFDGSPDPLLDVRITHDFPEVTTVTEVHGRMSKPELLLSSNPGRYTQAELLGFLLGGEPGGSPEDAPSAGARVAGAGASLISAKLGGAVKKALPVDIDVLRYEAASASSSQAVTVGTWITDTLFLAYRQHLSARPDENTGEGQLEYWIARRLVLEAMAGNRGVNGLDLLWRRRW